MNRAPVTPAMSLTDTAMLLADRYVATGERTAALQIAVEVDGGARKLLVTVSLQVDPVKDFSGMLPGVNR